MKKIIFINLVLLMLLPYISSGEQDFRKRLSLTSQEEVYKTTDDIMAEIIFGRELSARILGRYKLLEDESLTRYINLIGKGLAQYAGRPEINFYFGVLDTDEINAFSAPGGYIFITKGALKEIDNEGELAGVLSHEIIHITERHIVKEINLKATDESPVTGLSALIGGATRSFEAVFTHMIDQAYTILFERGYKMDDELQSDTLGTTLLYNAGYSPEALSVFLKRLKDKGLIKTIQGTHPGIEERLINLEIFLKEQGLQDIKRPDLKERYHESIKIR